ncbi:MAG: MaoC family dehydratase N-terminal domain-containing protein [Actinobacteria bacterium]|nr:MaoC family dehydratase N-terminal domain-containing protein [Actinomycetota bacterium]
MTGSASLAGAAERLEALVGRSGPPIHGVVERRDVERFARASGERSPIYFDEAAAAAAGHAGVPAPPLFLSAMINWDAGPALEELRPDGTGVDRERWLPLDGLRLMGGGQELELHRPVLAGQAFRALPTLESVTAKSGSSGALIVLVIRTEFRDDDEGLLLTCRESVIGR